VAAEIGFSAHHFDFDVNAVYGDPPHLAKLDRSALRFAKHTHREWARAGAFRIGWLRSVANIYHGFAIQCFTDELAHRANRDPVDICSI